MLPASASAVSRAIASVSASPESGLALEKCTPTPGPGFAWLALLSWVWANATPLIDSTAPQRKTALASAVMLVTQGDHQAGAANSSGGSWFSHQPLLFSNQSPAKELAACGKDSH